LLDDILYRRNLSEEGIRERLALYGLKQAGFFRVVIVRENYYQEAGVSQSHLFRDCCAKIRSVLGESLLVQKPDEAIIIASVQQQDVLAAPGWIKQLGKEFFSDKFPMAVGVGPSVAQATEIHSSYLIAKSTIKAGLAFQPGGLHFYSEYLARILLLRSKDTPEQKYLLLLVIDPLLAHDQRYNTQLLPTLGALIFADDLEAAAAALYVHINTVRYRLNKVKQLTGYDFFSARGRYTITTAFLMYQFSRCL